MVDLNVSPPQGLETSYGEVTVHTVCVSLSVPRCRKGKELYAVGRITDGTSEAEIIPARRNALSIFPPECDKGAEDRSLEMADRRGIRAANHAASTRWPAMTQRH